MSFRMQPNTARRGCGGQREAGPQPTQAGRQGSAIQLCSGHSLIDASCLCFRGRNQYIDPAPGATSLQVYLGRWNELPVAVKVLVMKGERLMACKQVLHR